MFVRHLKKFNNQAELEAALAAGMIASPYVAIDASDNVANMVMPSDKEPAEIEYTQEDEPTPVPAGPITISDYGVRSMFTSDINKWADLKFTAYVELPEGSDGSDMYIAGPQENVRFAFVRKDFFNYACENFDDEIIKSAPNAEQVDNTGKVIGHLLNGDLATYLPNFDEDYPNGFDSISFQPTVYSETSEDMPLESSAILRRAPLPEETFPYTVYCWSDFDDIITAPVPLTALDSSANPNMYTWIIVAGYTMGYDDKGIGYYVSNDGEYCYRLNELVIPPAQSLIRMTSPITPEYYVDDVYLAERLKFDASANALTDAYVQENWGDDRTMINVGDSTGVKYMFINKRKYYNEGYNAFGGDQLDDTDTRSILANFLNGDYNGAYEWGVETDASGGFISAVEDGDENLMWTPDIEDNEFDDIYTYYLIAGYAFDDGEGNDVFYPDYVYPIGTYHQPYYETSDASLLGFYGEWGTYDDGNGVTGYNPFIDCTPNSLYAEIGIGIYSKSAFENVYQESGTSDSSIEYLTTFRDNDNMLIYEREVNGVDGFCWNLFAAEGIVLNDDNYAELIPGYNEGDDLCMAAWWIDDEGNYEDAEFVATTEESEEPSDSSTEGSVRIVGEITPEYTRDTIGSYGHLTAFIHFNIEADAIENQDMTYGQYGWPFIYMSKKEEFDNHKQIYMNDNPGASDLDYIYAVISGETECMYYQLGTDEEEFLPIDLSGEFSWPDSSVAYYTYDELAVPPPYDSDAELAGTYYIFAVYTDGEWNPVSPSYSDAYVDLGEYEIESHIVDSSSLVTGSGAINGETIDGTTYITSRHQDFRLSVTPNSIFDRVMVGVYSSSYYNTLLEDYMNNQGYSEEAARDEVLSQMCTQRLNLDGTYYSADSSAELVDNVNVSPGYTGYDIIDDMLVLSGYCYSSTSNDRTEWLDFATQELPTVNLSVDVVSFDTTLSRAELSFAADANPIYDKVRFFICTNGYYEENITNYGWDWHAFAVDKVGNSSSTAVLDANNNYSNTAYENIVEGVNAESGYDGSVRVLVCYARLESSDGSIVSDVIGRYLAL